MRRICIQAGHWNTNNGQTGAPRELERTLAIGKRLVDLLKSIGVDAFLDDALPENNTIVTTTDWDVYLSLHCDANYAGDEGGGFIDWIDPSIDLSVESNKESERIAKAIEEIYFKESGIRNVPNRRNANTKFYYMWSELSENTHCVIIEMGESIDPHDNVILNDTERQAQILLRCIQNAYPDLKPVTPPEPLIDWKAKYDQRDQEYKVLLQSKELLQQQYNTLALQLQECQKQRDIYKAEYDNATKTGGYIEQIKYLEEGKKKMQDEISELTKQVGYWQTKYNNLKKPGLKFIQSAVIAICEKLGVKL